MESEQRDVSKQTIVVLVFLAILVSLLGTFTVLQEAGKDQADTPQTSNSAQGKVSLTIIPAIKPASTTGQVSLEIVPASGA